MGQVTASRDANKALVSPCMRRNVLQEGFEVSTEAAVGLHCTCHNGCAVAVSLGLLTLASGIAWGVRGGREVS